MRTKGQTSRTLTRGWGPWLGSCITVCQVMHQLRQIIQWHICSNIFRRNLANGEGLHSPARRSAHICRSRLDLYFSEPYFQHDVPRKALTNPLLKYAVCAYAAKHLHRTRKSKTRYHLPLMGSESTRPWYDSETLDWAWYDARYYAQAITLLRENLGRSQSSDDEASMPGTPGVACNVGGITDEVLAAMTILCCYEYMSASDTDWLRHLSGTMLLLDLQKDREKWHMSSYPSRARRSIFWNFARQDLYAACK